MCLGGWVGVGWGEGKGGERRAGGAGVHNTCCGSNVDQPNKYSSGDILSTLYLCGLIQTLN